jgi:[lysine-biosynthesis-protein LysW]---L-2-aminoadipate ligase
VKPTRTGRVGVIASRVRLDEKRILAALESRGIDFEYADSRAALYDIDGKGPPWSLALNREIGQIRAIYAARGLEAAGVRVINSAAAEEVCGDKWRTTVALRAAGVPMPRTFLALTPDAALEAIEQLGFPVVIKPLVGSWGRLVTALHDRRAAQAVMEYVAALPGPQSHVMYVQEMIQHADHDIRAIVIGGQVIGAVYRIGQWRSNVALGAITEPCPMTPELENLARSAAQAVGAEIAGVDLLSTEHDQLTVLEVNSGVEFSGFQRALGDDVNVAERIADYLITRM